MARYVRSRGTVVDRGLVVERDPEIVDEVVTDDVVHTAVARAPWSPAQLVALAIGAMFTILGAVALARTGIDFENVSAQHVTVAGFHHTALLGLLEFMTGLFLIAVGAVPGGARPTMTFFGMLLLGFGLVVAIEPNAFHSAMGTHGGHGALYALSGAILLVTAMVAPVFLDGDRRYSRRAGISRGRVIR